MSNARPPAVELKEVFCVHRTPEGDAAALQGATFSVERGELVGVVGRSGAGKSTLLRTIAGLQTPSAGSVCVFGRDIGRLGERARARFRHELIGFLGQRADTALPPDLTIAKAIALPLALRAVPAPSRRTRVRELLKAVALEDRGDALPADLSGGERQRAALCAALAHEPVLLLADEPTGELDTASADAVRALIAELVRARGITAIIVSHDPSIAAIADRALRLSDGRVAHENPDGTIAVGNGGWLQLPTGLLREAGIARLARVRLGAGGLIVTAAHSETRVPAKRPGEAPTEPATRAATWTPSSITLDAVTRSRGAGAARRPVLTEFTDTFGPGRLIAITGPSGSGKTTLLRLLAGLDLPDAGELWIDGTELGAAGPEELAALRRERIGYLAQEPSPIGFLTARENIVLALALRGWFQDAVTERADDALLRVDLSDRGRQRVARLSAGEAQRVALARALATARGLLLVDEPTSRLDQANAAAVATLLAAAASTDGQTVVCATHDPELIARADEIVDLR
jgi:ABC-type lipoprotein export system ATPase subunit